MPVLVLFFQSCVLFLALPNTSLVMLVASGIRHFNTIKCKSTMGHILGFHRTLHAFILGNYTRAGPERIGRVLMENHIRNMGIFRKKMEVEDKEEQLREMQIHEQAIEELRRQHAVGVAKREALVAEFLVLFQTMKDQEKPSIQGSYT